ncbi:hypothetical protein [Amycolatopsis sp. lyj-23]|uniref:hypothetical protein n=1 Tax=Amycolatopsis sp. lyj-23 TaxID=2789283 RepID=UPI00397A5703
MQLVEQFAEEARSEVRSAAVGLLPELEQYRGWLAIPGQQWRQAGARLDRRGASAVIAGEPERHTGPRPGIMTRYAPPPRGKYA